VCGNYNSAYAIQYNQQHAPPCLPNEIRQSITDISFGVCSTPAAPTPLGMPTAPPTLAPAMDLVGEGCPDIVNSTQLDYSYWPPPVAQYSGTPWPLQPTVLGFNVNFASYSGFSGTNFDPEAIASGAYLGKPECMYPMPVTVRNFSEWRGRCTLNPFVLDMSLPDLTAVTVYLTSTTAAGVPSNKVFTFNGASELSQCRAIINRQIDGTNDDITDDADDDSTSTPANIFARMCVVNDTLNPPTYSRDHRLKLPLYGCWFIPPPIADASFWSGSYYLTVEFQFTNGYSIAETASMFYPQSSPPRVEPFIFTASQPHVPSQMLSLYEATELPGVQSGATLTGSVPAVAEIQEWLGPYAGGFVNMTDFNTLMELSNLTGLTPSPFQPGEQPVSRWLETPTITDSGGVADHFSLFEAVDPEIPTYPNSIQNNPSSPGGEASLDIQWIGGVSRAATSWVYHSGYFTQTIYGAYPYGINQADLKTDGGGLLWLDVLLAAA
jgi:hypothetical protein